MNSHCHAECVLVAREAATTRQWLKISSDSQPSSTALAFAQIECQKRGLLHAHRQIYTQTQTDATAQEATAAKSRSAATEHA